MKKPKLSGKRCSPLPDIYTPIDKTSHLVVSHSVAKAARESGVAQRQLDDDYFESTSINLPLWA
jgi:hypothetical protein